MTAAELRAYLERMDMPTNEAADLVGMDKRRMRRAAAGEFDDSDNSVVAPPVARLFWLIECVPCVLEALLAWDDRDTAAKRLDEFSLALDWFVGAYTLLSDDEIPTNAAGKLARAYRGVQALAPESEDEPDEQTDED